MDLNSLKEKAIGFKKDIGKQIDKSIKYGAKKLSESSFTISKKEEFENFIKKSKTTDFINKETGEKKQFKHKSILIFGDQNSDFFKDSLLNFPILATKAFSQNINLKLAHKEIKDIDLVKYGIKEFPCFVVFENEKIYKIINGEENIQKLVKSINLDINKEIEKF